MSKRQQTYFPSAPIHPGVTLLEVIESLSLSTIELGVRTGISKKHLSNILNAKALITPEVALKLEKATGTKASFWNNLSSNYQASLAAIEERAHIEAEAKNIVAFKETYQELSDKKIVPTFRWVKNNYFDITRELLHFFSTHSLAYIPQTQSAAYRRYDQTVNNNTMAAVIRLGERKAQSVITDPFDKNLLKESLLELKSYSLLNPTKYMPLLEEKLRTCGVVLVCVPGFKHTGLQGAAKWIDTNKAMIILKSDGQTESTSMFEDKFWFNLFHELAHLLLHGKSQTFIDLEDNPNSQEEQEANAFATKQFMDGFVISDLDKYKKGGSISAENAIKDLAKRFGISTSIVAGQLSRLFQDRQNNVYAVLNDYKKRISYTNYSI